MKSRYLTALALAALIGAPSVAAAATPMPSNMKSMNSMNNMSNMKTKSSMKMHKKKNNSNGVQSTRPGAPGYSNSAPLGSAEKKKP
jgi:hypothetical protein